jgi:hypothetical protein
MKWAIVIAVLFWLLCGLAGAWMMGDVSRDNWKAIARGPITLAKAIGEEPPASVPMPD